MRSRPLCTASLDLLSSNSLLFSFLFPCASSVVLFLAHDVNGLLIAFEPPIACFFPSRRMPTLRRPDGAATSDDDGDDIACHAQTRTMRTLTLALRGASRAPCEAARILLDGCGQYGPTPPSCMSLPLPFPTSSPVSVSFSAVYFLFVNLLLFTLTFPPAWSTMTVPPN